ncbi:MAG: glycosyltransferase [Thermomicrobiales bacterium]
MKLVVTAEHHFVRSPDGTHWGPDSMTYRFWERYLDVFDRVSVVVRVRNVDRVSAEFTRADGPGATIRGMPEYTGPREYLRVRREFQRAAANATGPDDAVLLRVGCSPLAAAVESELGKRNQPFGVEVITDPYMVFAPGAIRHPLRPAFRRMYTRQLQRQCTNAVAATYVTRAALQERYPAGATTFVTSYSDVDLPPQALVDRGRSGELRGSVPTVVSIGSMAQLYKGFDVLIDAIARCAQRGLNVNLILVGDGKHRPELEHQVRQLGLQRQVTFTGQLAGGTAVRTELDKADLFVLASRTEGLPRAIIEAQARALPCLGTRIGGIPELLDETCLVRPDDAEDLAESMLAMMRDPIRRAFESERNLTAARTFSQSEIAARRLTFLRELRDRTCVELPRRSLIPPSTSQSLQSRSLVSSAGHRPEGADQ